MIEKDSISEQGRPETSIVLPGFVSEKSFGVISKAGQDEKLRDEDRDSRPLTVFAGVWTTWHGGRGTKANPVEGEHQLFGFLTTDANAEVGAIHPKAMPVILTTPEEIQIWMTAPAEEALKRQRPLPDGVLKVVATGEEKDEAAVAA